MHEDNATDIFVEGKTYPHSDKSEAEGNTDDITHADGYAPLEDNTDNEGVDDIACGAQCAASKDVGSASNLEEDVDKEYPNAHLNNFLIVGKGTEKGK